MIRIELSPQNKSRSETLTVERGKGDRLRINGELFNFDTLNDGDIIPADAIPCEWIIGQVAKVNGVVRIELTLPFGSAPDRCVAFPEPIIDPPEGLVELPFSAWSETLEERVEGGTNVTRTTHRWQQADDVSVEFIPDPVPEQTSDPVEEPSHVEP